MLFQPPSRGGGRQGGRAPVVFYASAPPYQPQPCQRTLSHASQVPQTVHGLRLLRAPSVPMVRYSTVGPVGPGVALKGLEAVEGEGPVPGLAKFLQALGLETYYLAVRRWASEQGACNLSELVENADDLAAALKLAPPKAAELKSSGQLARQMETEVSQSPAPKMMKAVSTPVAVQSVPSVPSVPVYRSNVVVQAAPAARALGLSRAMATNAGGMDRTETDLWDEREAAAHASVGVAADVCEPDSRSKEPNWQRWATPPRTRWRVDEAILRRRIPGEAEIKVKERAVAEAEAAAREEWGDEPDKPCKPQDSRPSRFETMRGQFLEQYGPSLQQELGRGYRFVPADVAPAVQEKFLQECDRHGAPDYGYHGTRAVNIPSILSQGLRVPSAASGVRVANGSAHGVGIYTGMPGNVWLSRGFADTKDMLICGVVDPDAEPRPAPAAADATAAPPRRVGGHKNHHKPVVSAPANLVPKPAYQIFTHRESDGIKVVGGARVIFKEERVAPLFVAQPVESSHTFTRAATDNKAASRGGHKGQVYIPQTGEVVWDCWEEHRDWNARRVKRILVTKERQQQRAAARQEKEEMQGFS